MRWKNTKKKLTTKLDNALLVVIFRKYHDQQTIFIIRQFWILNQFVQIPTQHNSMCIIIWHHFTHFGAAKNYNDEDSEGWQLHFACEFNLMGHYINQDQFTGIFSFDSWSKIKDSMIFSKMDLLPSSFWEHLYGHLKYPRSIVMIALLSVHVINVNYY